ncbi:Opi3p [Saccharomyces cerevisiae YJM1401]|nr:Opi3p [Saccharomyces cerevisiae YJM1401]
MKESVQEIIQQLIHSVDLQSSKFQLAIVCTMFNPIFWNIVARMEYHKHSLTKMCGGARKGCYMLAATIFSLGIVRDMVYESALREQPTCSLITGENWTKLGVALFGLGQVLVLSSMYKLGITGTYLGDYFGILMDERVTGFPFNVSNNPMYQGSTLSFLGIALYKGRPAGLVVSAVVYFMYKIALRWEEPFTAMIYANRDKAKKNM